MATFRVKVKTVSWDWLTIETDNAGDIQKILDCEDGFEEAHDNAWTSAGASDGPEDGYNIEHIMKVKD